jgi:hypothetical protein
MIRYKFQKFIFPLEGTNIQIAPPIDVFMIGIWRFALLFMFEHGRFIAFRVIWA